MRNTMRLPAKRALPIAAALFASAMGVAIPSMAQSVNCADLSHPVYIAGSSAVQPLIAAISPTFAALSPPITLVYLSSASCLGVGYMTTQADGSFPGTITGPANTYPTDPNTAVQCLLTPLVGNAVDIGVSDVYPATCGLSTPLESSVREFHGPIQSMAFAVPRLSTQTTISAEAAYTVFGFVKTGSYPIAPWTDASAIFVRDNTSGTQLMISAALAQVGSGFSASKVQGVCVPGCGSGDVQNGLTSSAAQANPDKFIGFLAMDRIDKNRASLKPLTFQFKGQSCGFTPDSTDNSFDKQNTRDGHYYIWGPLHMLTPTGSDGKAKNPDVQKVIDLLTGMPTDALLTQELAVGVVPDCAMRVTRTEEVGPMASYMPPQSCECAYLAKSMPAAPASCKPCTTASPPDRPACNLGYWEVQ